MIPIDYRKPLWKLLAAGGLALAVTGCSMSGVEKTATESIDAPPASVENQMLQLADDAMAPMGSSAIADGLTVYLKDSRGYIAPMTLDRSKQEGKPGQSAPELEALAWMTSDAKLAGQLPPGFTPVLPKGTVVSSVVKNPEAGSVTVDFAQPLAGIPASDERKALEAIVWTMTELPGIDKVHLTVAGQPMSELPATGVPVPGVLTRNIGINLERSPQVKASDSMAVTLYFSAKNEQGDGYFVPVTRLVERQSDRARAALGELIKGPQDTNSLNSVMLANTTVEDLALKSDTVQVKLQEQGWTAGLSMPTEMMEGLVLTLTEATGAPKVSVAVNGSSELTGTNNETYEQPVERPTQINAYTG
ncbi:GerMN domain-containing protein [Cohnella sp. JJ-181]|uniref:GerMN domain-containing protein n=1 Tax=Cohnella rhizoplanae TaxID=2974897 RepID=UPI0022FFA8E5|nr:GerMN domain-containing protein [Cohnella sp. JJ-181]CAI6082232.1 Spore germination protein GerM [Cohnella sp. JJ-181]